MQSINTENNFGLLVYINTKCVCSKYAKKKKVSGQKASTSNFVLNVHSNIMLAVSLLLFRQLVSSVCE